MVTVEEIILIAKDYLSLSTDWQLTDLDSFMMVDLLVQLEQRFDIVFEVGEWEDLSSLDDLAALVNKKIKQS